THEPVRSTVLEVEVTVGDAELRLTVRRYAGIMICRRIDRPAGVAICRIGGPVFSADALTAAPDAIGIGAPSTADNCDKCKKSTPDGNECSSHETSLWWLRPMSADPR